MIKLIAKPWDAIKSLFALMFPMFAGGGGAWGQGTGAAGRWAARLVVGAILLVPLWLVNQWDRIGLRNVVHLGEPLNGLWLPAFAACLYGMLWLGWWLWHVLNLEIEPPTSEFPDIDRAWAEATAALDQAGIRIDETPLFLVLGSTAGPDEALFQAAGLKATVKSVPRGPAQPLHVTANRDGVWVTCLGASLLGRLHTGADDGGGRDDALMTLSEPDDDAMRTFGVGDKGETLRIEDFMAEMRRMGQAKKKRPPRRTAAELEPTRARLRRLCRLIARDRKGWCPANGVLVVLPVTAVDEPGLLDDLAQAIQTDLADAFATFQVRCPVLFLVSDLDRLPGFAELVERLPSKQLTGRMGQRFPLVPKLSPDAVADRVEDSVAWTGESLFPTVVLSKLQVESSGGEDVADLIRVNTRMFQFLLAMRQRNEALAKLVRDGLPRLAGEPLMFGGCYFAGTGTIPGSEQAFATGVLSRLRNEQDFVTWTEQAIRDDQARHRLARRLKTGLTLAIVAGVVAILGLIGWKVASPGPGADA